MKRTGRPCGGPAFKDGLCVRHLPAAVASRPAAITKSHATRRANLAALEEVRREVKAGAEEPTLRRGLAQMYRNVQREGEPQWRRWLVQEMIKLDMDTLELCRRLGVRYENASLFKRRTSAPAPVTVGKLEVIFGPFPREIKQEILRLRSSRTGGKVTQRKLKEKVKKWPRSRLEQELKAMRGLTDDKGRLLPEFRAALPNIYDRPLGVAGYEIYKKACAKRARSGSASKPFYRTRTASPIYRTPQGHLRYMLARLRLRKHRRFFQCQACGVWWERSTAARRGVLCAPCWQDHDRVRGAWILNGRRGSPPPLPRRSGGNSSPQR